MDLGVVTDFHSQFPLHHCHFTLGASALRLFGSDEGGKSIDPTPWVEMIGQALTWVSGPPIGKCIRHVKLISLSIEK